MGAITPHYTPDMGGGHVGGIPSSQLKDDEFHFLRNFYTYGPKIVRRGGTRQITSAPYGERVVDLFQYKDSNGVLQILAGTYSGFAYLNGMLLQAVPSPGLIPDNTPGYWVQYLDVAYYVRNSSNLWRGDKSGMSVAGITAPSAAPTLADGGAGVMEAGKRYIVYRYRNSRTRALSDWSPSANITIAASHQITVSALAAPLEAQADQIEILITTPDGAAGTYFHAVYVTSVTASTTVNLTVDQLGQASQVNTNDLPPAGLTNLTVWDERGWASDGRYVYYTSRDLSSQTALMESWPVNNTIPVSPDDGHPIRALLPFSVTSAYVSTGAIGRLVVAKTNGIWFIVPNSTLTGYSLQNLDVKVGCTSGHSMQGVNGMLIWFGTGKQFFLSENGGEPVPLMSPKIKDYLDLVPDADIDKVVAAVFPQLNWYVATLPQTSGNWVVLVFNYVDKNWSVFTHTADIHFLASVVDSNFAQLLYALTTDGNIYRYNDPTYGRDFGSKFWAEWQGKSWQPQVPGYLLSPRFLDLQCDTVAHVDGDCTLSAVGEDDVVIGTRNASLYQPAQVKRYVLPWKDYAASQLAARFRYQGEQPLEMQAYTLWSIDTQRMSQAS